jgi:dCTP deaminase
MGSSDPTKSLQTRAVQRWQCAVDVRYCTYRRAKTTLPLAQLAQTGNVADDNQGVECMAIMSDRWIREKAMSTGMIEPFIENQRREGCISYGLSSYGYDARVADEFKIFTNVDSAVVDPKDFAANSFVDRKTDVCVIPPNSFALARTVEYFRVPRDVLVICLGKSTYARCGIIVNVTPLEPGWEGHVTLEFSNTTPLPAKIYANEGACQFLFLEGNEPCETSYADRAGKYMGQRGVTLPRL